MEREIHRRIVEGGDRSEGNGKLRSDLVNDSPTSNPLGETRRSQKRFWITIVISSG